MKTEQQKANFAVAWSAYVEGDFAEAERILRPIAEEGHAESQCMLGYMYRDGMGVIQNYKHAFDWYLRAALRGNSKAQLSLGRMYDRGWGVRQDFELAVAWMRMAADRGLAEGQLELGQMYETGTGVPKDEWVAFSWFDKAAAQGWPPFNLSWAAARARTAGA